MTNGLGTNGASSDGGVVGKGSLVVGLEAEGQSWQRKWRAGWVCVVVADVVAVAVSVRACVRAWVTDRN